MELKLLIIFALLHQPILGKNYSCGQKSALLLLKRPAYDFSMRILDRVAQNNDAHFVFSPLSTWLQLSALAEGANGNTLREIWKVTRHHKNWCFKMKLAEILRNMNKEITEEYTRTSVAVVDELLAPKKRYMNNVQKLYGVKVFGKNFGSPDRTAKAVNSFLERTTYGVIKDVFDASDFYSADLLLSDSVFFKSAWKTPFNPVYTNVEPFFANANQYTRVLADVGGAGRADLHNYEEIGKVKMMATTGYFNITTFPLIKAKVLEIPCVSTITMLLFLPMNDAWVGDTFFHMQRTKLTSIFNMFKHQGEKLVSVKLPRFKISSDVDNLSELVYDMGVRRMFDSKYAELSRISNYRMSVSLMAQIAGIEVTEEGVTAGSDASADFLLNKTDDSLLEFTVNRPFAYMIVDRKTQLILFAGTYTTPSVY